jgi:hypothetical protein
MKSKLNKTMLLFLIVLVVALNMLSLTIISVAESNYNIEVVGEDYEFLKTVGSENQKFNYYNIVIKLKNNGSEESDDITLTIWEKNENKSLLAISRVGIINAGETMQFMFEDWVVAGIGEHTVMYEYHPTNTSRINNYNSGSGSFKITAGSITENTSGFELVLILFAVISIYLIRRRIK